MNIDIKGSQTRIPLYNFPIFLKLSVYYPYVDVAIGSVCSFVLYTLWLMTLINMLGKDMLNILLLFGVVFIDLLWIWFTLFIGYTPTLLTLKTLSEVSGSL